MKWIDQAIVKLALRRNRGGNHASAADPEAVLSRAKEIRMDAIFALSLLVVSFFLDHYLESSRIGHDLNQWAYERLQSLLPSTEKAQSIVVVDLGDRFDIDDAGTTDLNSLGKLLDQVVAQKPKAIAIDVDFGYLSKAGTWLDSRDEVTSRALRATNAGIPSFLAVGRGLEKQDKAAWLGTEDFAPLVVHPYFPEEGLTTGPVTFPEEIILGQYRHFSIAKALAEVVHVGNKTSRENLLVTPYYTSHGTAQHYPEEHGGELFGHRYYLNFSSLERLKASTLSATPQGLADTDLVKLSGALVVIGSLDPVRDGWIRPDTKTREAGVYLHAIAVDTLVNSPVYRLRPIPRALLNLAGLTLLFLLATSAQFRSIAHGDGLSAPGHHLWAVTLVVALQICVAIALALSFSVLWIDFVLVCVMAAVHPAVEHRVKHMHHHFFAPMYRKLMRK